MEYEALLFDLLGTLVDERGRAIEGAARLLRELAWDRWAIVTSAPRRLAESLLERSALPLPAVLVAADMVPANKPAPDGYLLTARLLRREPARCLVFEDSAQGVAAARAAGMDVVAITASGTRLNDVRVTALASGAYRVDY